MGESIAKIIAWVAWALPRYGKVLGFGAGQELAVIGIGSDQTACHLTTGRLSWLRLALQ